MVRGVTSSAMLLRSSPLEDPVPPVPVQLPPYHRTNFRDASNIEHHLGQVNNVRLDYGIETRKPWGTLVNLPSVDVKKSKLKEAGFGLFAGQFIRENMLCSQYHGVRISWRRAMQLLLEVCTRNLAHFFNLR